MSISGLNYSFFLLILSIFPFKSIAQINLVPNPSLEEDIPSKPTQKFNHNRKGTLLVNDWWQPTGGSTDYYNSDKSTVSSGCPVHTARTGTGRLGLIFESSREKSYKEYAQCRLISSLKKDRLYSVSFFIVLDKRSAYHANSIGAYFSNDAVSSNYSLKSHRFTSKQIFEVPQVVTWDTSILSNNKQWSLIHGYYRSNGDEQYLTIGSFGNSEPDFIHDYETKFYDYSRCASKFIPEAYYYLDDVFVYEVSDTVNDDYKRIIDGDKNNQTYNNIVLVLDVSQSMQKADKISNLKKGVDSLISLMNKSETISILTFDALPRTLAQGIKVNKKTILITIIDSLKASGGTNVKAAIKKAYSLIDSTYVPLGNNRIVLITDAGFNISRNSKKEIEKYYKDKGVGFSTLIFNDIKYKKLQHVSKNNNGIYLNVSSNTFSKSLQQQLVRKSIKEEYTKKRVYLMIKRFFK